MEYLFTKEVNSDGKRRIKFPSAWVNPSVNKEFVFVKEDEIKLYPYFTWKEIFDKEKKGKDQIDFMEKSLKVEMDKSQRILLPKYLTWKKINLIGMGDYIVIRESTG